MENQSILAGEADITISTESILHLQSLNNDLTPFPSDRDTCNQLCAKPYEVLHSEDAVLMDPVIMALFTFIIGRLFSTQNKNVHITIHFSSRSAKIKYPGLRVYHLLTTHDR